MHTRPPSKRSGSPFSSTSWSSRTRSTCRQKSRNSRAVTADAIFVFMTEIETAAFLDEVQAQALEKPIYGGDVLSAASTIALVQPGAADGTKTHVGLNASAPVFADWIAAYAAFHPAADPPDHNSIKGYLSVYIVKEPTEQVGSFDNSQFSDIAHCTTITVANEPGLLLDVSYDGNGDIDRESFIIEVVDGVGQIVADGPTARQPRRARLLTCSPD